MNRTQAPPPIIDAQGALVISRTQAPLPITDAQGALVMSRTQAPPPIIDAQATDKEGPSRLPTDPGDDLA
jgi:hypothetical protein